MPAELVYCYVCWSWFTLESWGEHCEWHLSSVTSKRCASLTERHTLLRPAFCPFCLGDTPLPPSKRWLSYTRDTRLWTYTESLHLNCASWPLHCPHPFCDIGCTDEQTFRYYLADMHYHKLMKRAATHPRKKLPSTIFSSYDPGTQCRKRKSEVQNEDHHLCSADFDTREDTQTNTQSCD